MNKAVQCLLFMKRAAQNVNFDISGRNIICSNTTALLRCLSETMVSCPSVNRTTFELLQPILVAIIRVCATTEPEPSCELKAAHDCRTIIVEGLYNPSNPLNSDTTCRVFAEFHKCTRNISLTCPNVGDLTIELVHKSWWALESYCPNPRCSITQSTICLNDLYNKVTVDMSDTTVCQRAGLTSAMRAACSTTLCQLTWSTQTCIESNTIECSSDIRDAIFKKLVVVTTVGNLSAVCVDPCSTVPCRNNATCVPINSANYTCQCPDQYTGNNCEIDVGCDKTAIRACLLTAKDVIVGGLLDPCKSSSANCSIIDSLLVCLGSKTTTCDISTGDRIDLVVTALRGLKVLCPTTSNSTDQGNQKCYSCVNADSNAGCNSQGMEFCRSGEVCQTVVDTKNKSSYKKGCKNRQACKAGAQGNSGKCIYCCTGPDCDQNPEAQSPGFCGGEYTTAGRRKRQLISKPPCDVQPASCKIQQTQICVITYVEALFTEYTKTNGPDYVTLCSGWSKTTSCITQNTVACTGPLQLSINQTIVWLQRMTGQQCSQPICYPDQAGSCLDNILSEVQAYKLRPSVPVADRNAFCRIVGDCRNCVKQNLAQCPQNILATNTSSLDTRSNTTQQLVGDFCTFPCDSSPCQNNASCVEVAYNQYQCVCADEFMGVNCQLANPIYPYQNDTQIDCSSRVGVFPKIRLINQDIKIFGISRNSFYVSENGYISFDDQSMIVNYDKFCSKSRTIIAPLYAKQDCSCSGSVIYTRVYFSATVSMEERKVLIRAQNDVIRYSKTSVDFSVSSVIVITWTNMFPYPCRIYQKPVFGMNQGSSYQLVLASDSQNTYAMFNYLNVDVQYQIPAVHMGITDMSGRCQGSYLSGSASMNHFELAKSNTDDAGRWLYQMFDNVTMEVKPEDQCLAWTKTTTDLSKADIDPCPCSGALAALDPRFSFEYIDWFRYCYSSNRLQKPTANGQQSNIRLKQVCCYDPFSKGSLVMSPPYSGFPRIIQGAKINDSVAYNWCCVDSTRYCSLFFTLRPIGKCDAYRSPVQALLWGDPHFLTHDGLDYTFNGIGEFTMIKTVDNSFRLQARTAQMINAQGALVAATSFVAFAAQEAGSVKVQVELGSSNEGLLISVNGQSISTTIYSVTIFDTVIASDGLVVNITFPSGYGLRITTSGSMLSIQNVIPLSFFSKTIGLLGTYNANPNDDLTTPDGTILPSTSSWSDIHYKFGLLWQITSGESLFVYPTGKSTSDYIDTKFVPAFEAPCYTAKDMSAGKAVCGNNKNCYYDYCVTKDTSIAQQTRSIETQFQANQNILNVAAPILRISELSARTYGAYVINATVGVQLTFTLTASSDMRVQYSIIGNVSKQARVSLDSSSGVFRWTPTSLDPVDLSFTAVDTKGGVSPKLQVIVTICAGCGGNNGYCNFASYLPLGSGLLYRQADCSCKIGWTGEDCRVDIDGCASGACQTKESCRDMTPTQQQTNNIPYICTACPPGYSTNQCTDVDECALKTAQCAQKCTNTVGSYKCSCAAGFRLSGVYLCVDIDECAEETANCTHTCTNTVGSFTCACRDGFSSANPAAGNNCVADAVCSASTGCAHACSIVGNNPTCICRIGYTLGLDRKSCQDINECVSTTMNKCSMPASCVNTDGGYTCSCSAGFGIGPDQRTCQSCADGAWGINCQNPCNCGANVLACDKMTGCSVCRPGWTGAPACATDIDECSIGGVAKCEENSFCQNLNASYRCVCSPGYTKNTITNLCTDVDECALKSSTCSQKCINTAGSFQCSCFPGYRQFANQGCKDIDECSEQATGCSQTCINTDGSYQCACNAGYLLVDDLKCVLSGRVARFRLRLAMEWNILLANSRSSQAINLHSILERQLTLAFRSIEGFKQVHVRQFSSGSVRFDLLVESDTVLTKSDQSDVANALTAFLDSNLWKLETMSATSSQVLDSPQFYLSDDLTVQVLNSCSVSNALNMCKNGGTCVAGASQPVCQCSSSFTGNYCDVPTMNTALVIGLSVMGAVLFIALVITVVCFLRSTHRFTQNPRKAYETTPSEISADDESIHKSSAIKTRLNPQWVQSSHTPSPYNYHEGPALSHA